MWYSQKTMPKVYQQDANLNRQTGLVDVFYKIGPDPFGYGNANREWPWSDPNTLPDNDPNVVNRVGLLLPGKPVVVYLSTRKLMDFSRPTVTVYAWKFPVGTDVFEVVYNKVDGKFAPFKLLRATKNHAGGWDRKAYRPFPSAAEYAEAVGEPVRIESFRAGRLSNRHPAKKTFTGREVALAPLPPSRVYKLLMNTPFKECLGKDFYKGAFAPTSNHPGQIVPRGYVGGYFSGKQEDCQQCHRDTLTHASLHEPGRDWYGFVRGSDEVFSFNPFSYASVGKSGEGPPPALNPTLVSRGVVKWRDSRDNPADYGGFQ